MVAEHNGDLAGIRETMLGLVTEALGPSGRTRMGHRRFSDRVKVVLVLVRVLLLALLQVFGRGVLHVADVHGVATRCPALCLAPVVVA